MELREFAERVLFATTLEEKLQAPAEVTDDSPGSPLITPAAPGRQVELRFKPQASGKAEFPSVHHLEREQERGRLLHFFANHELLATELMALALLCTMAAAVLFQPALMGRPRTREGWVVHRATPAPVAAHHAMTRVAPSRAEDALADAQGVRDDRE